MRPVSLRLFSVAVAVLCLMSLACGCTRISEELPETAQPAASGGFAEKDGLPFGEYIYSELTPSEQKNYHIIRRAADNFETTAVFDEKIEPNELRKLYVSVYNTCFEDFWLSSLFYRPDEASDTLSLSYRFDRKQAYELKKELEEKTEQILSELPEDATYYRKCLYFHDYLVLNCTFSNDTDYCNTAYGALVDGKAQCEGYAFAYNYLCRKAGIECISVWGTNSENATHAWNIVLLDGNYYHVDCTWDDPVLTEYTPGFLRHYYFLVKDSDILGTTHFLDGRYYEWPACYDDNNYYRREGLYCTSASESNAMMENAAVKAFESGAMSFGIRCSDKQTYNAVCDSVLMPLNARSYITNALRRAGKDSSYGTLMSYRNDNEYIVHVSVMEK